MTHEFCLRLGRTPLGRRLLRNPEAKRRLVDEVRCGAWPDLEEAPSYEELEKLPFLASAFLFQSQACSKDGIEYRH